jgi:two-component system, cell cycle sensor histidine kinase and response regulator CckA
MTTLHEGAEDYRQLFEVTPLPMIVYDTETCAILSVNRAATETYGYSSTEFLALTMKDLLCTEDFARFQVTALTPLSKTLWRHRKKNGDHFDVESSGYPVQFNSRQARLKIVVDITEQLRRETQLQASERQYRELYEQANDAIYTHDLQGNLTSMNEAGLRFLGFAPEELIGRNMAQLLPPEDFARAQEMIHRKLAGEVTYSVYEVCVITKDGRLLPAELSTTLIYQDGQPLGVQGIARVLTERKRVEEQLRQAQKMEAVGRLAGGIAHDFNNRLTAIQGFTDLLLKRADKESQQHYYLEQIKIASERAAELTRQLLTFSRKQVLHPKILNLNEVVSDWGNLVRVLLGENIAVHLILGSDIGLVKADPGQLEHVMMNLALNACDAMPGGGDFTIETTDLEISELQARFNPSIPPGEYVRLLIRDNGIGMDEETRSHLFEPFFTTKERGKGTGLGLFTAYGIIKQSGGFIETKSAPNEGTTFLIYLPVVKTEKVISTASVTAAAVAAGKESILVVEDEPTVRKLVRAVLEGAGYIVLEASYGPEALATVTRHPDEIELLLTDVRMPGMDGCDLAEKVKSLSPHTRVLYMSAYTDDPRVLDASLGADSAFLQKPFAPDALTKMVRDLLDRVVERVAATA